MDHDDVLAVQQANEQFLSHQNGVAIVTVNLYDWYWLADDGRIWSSNQQKLVDVNDEGYQSHLAMIGNVTVWPKDDSDQQTESSLQAVLPQGLYASLARLQDELCNQVNTQAQNQRDLYVVPGGVQAVTYDLKRQEAETCLSAKSVDETKSASQLAQLYPYLANEIGLTIDPTSQTAATDVYGVARAVLAVYDVWLKLNLAIERHRLKTNKDIRAAQSVDETKAVFNQLNWTMVGN